MSVLKSLMAENARKMKHQVAAAMPKFFENWCHRFDDLFSR